MRGGGIRVGREGLHVGVRRASRAGKRALCTVAGALGILAGSSAPALALETHVFSTSFSGSGANALSNPQGVAIDQMTGEVYVVDEANNRVEIFSGAGAFISAFGAAGSGSGQFKEPSQVAVDNSGALPGNVYVLDAGNERVEVFNAKGEYQAQITSADLAATKPGQPVGSLQGVAVDALGNLWIYDSNANMYRFPKGDLPGGFAFNTGFSVSPGLALDSSSHFYVIYGSGFPEVLKAGPNGEYLATSDGCGCATAVAIDPVGGDLYVDQGTSVAHVLAANGSGTPNDTFASSGPGRLTLGSGVAVNGSVDSVYVADATANRVNVYNAATLPDVTTEAGTAVTKTAALLHGTVNPDKTEVTACEFEWGTEPGVYPNEAACSSLPGSGGAPVAVSAEITSLGGNTTYYYRLAATNAGGTNVGLQESLTTVPAVDALSTGPAQEIARDGTSATLTGSLSPDGADSHYYFQYGTQTTYGSVSPAPPGNDAGSVSESVHAETALAGLTANTTYHYRLVGVNSFGTTFGEDKTFATPPAAPALSTGPAEGVSETGATLTGSLSPDGADTHYYFQYGTQATYGSVSPAPPGNDAGSAYESVRAETVLAGLTANTTYHYRLVGVTSFGTTFGADATLTTPGPPAVDSESSESVKYIAATLQAQITPDGSETGYQFEYGETAAYSNISPGVVGLGSGEGPVSVPAATLTGLTPNTTYHYRVVASNGYGTVNGPDQTFTTLAPARAIIDEDSVSSVTATSATLQAQINSLGSDTTAYFQYGTVSCASSPASCTATPTPPGSDVGSAESDQPLSIVVANLAPATTYHFRAVAVNGLGTVYGAEQTFTTQAATKPFALPDGRQWELVSPANKNGGSVLTVDMAFGGNMQAAEDGQAVTYGLSAPAGTGPKSSPIDSQVFSRRGHAGWSTEDLATPHREASARENGGTLHFGELDEYLAFSPDLRYAWVQPEGHVQLSAVPARPPGYYENYVRDNISDSFTPTVGEGNTFGTGEGPMEVPWYNELAAIARGSRFIVQVPFGTRGAGEGQLDAPLGIAVQKSSGSVFVADSANKRVEVFGAAGEYKGVITGTEVPGGSLETVSGVAVDNSEREATSVSAGDVYVVDRARGVVDKFKPAGKGYEYVCEITGPSSGCVKEGASQGFTPTSVAVDGFGGVYVGQSEGPVDQFDPEGHFVAALGQAFHQSTSIAVNYQGTAVYVATEAGTATKLLVNYLTHEAPTTVALAEHGVDAVAVDETTGNVYLDSGSTGVRVYMEAQTERPGESPLQEFATGGEIAGGSPGIAFSSEGAGTVYALDGSDSVQVFKFGPDWRCNPNSSPAKGTGYATGDDGCYVYYPSEGSLFVAHGENGEWTNTQVAAATAEAIPWGSPHIELSSNGRYLAFMSNGRPTGYNNLDAITGAADEEVYLYDAAANHLVCASCNPTGARPVGVFDNARGTYESAVLVDRAVEWAGATLAGSLPDWIRAGQEVSVYQPRFLFDSGRLFFNSADPLVPQAVNGLEDVYEYEPEGVGSCRQAGGCISLISSGASKQESAFVDASANGDDAFFMTTGRLASADYDALYDIYDAHVCSASVPCIPAPPVSPPPCETSDSCKAPPTPQPTIFGPPPSATFVGAGNASPPPAATKVPPPPTRAQRLAAALRACAKKKRGRARRSCEAQARRRYGAKPSRAAGVRGRAKSAKHSAVRG